jgi:hypothetical protein
MPRSRVVALLAAGAAAAASAALALPAASAAPHPSAPAAKQLYIYQVPADQNGANKLFRAGFDVLERRTGADLYVLGDSATANRLRSDGFAPTVSETLPPMTWKAPPSHSGQKITPADDGETYYGGYHTVAGQYAHLDQIASDHADLAKEYTYGQSYLKAQGQGGYDLKAICVTHIAKGDCELNPNAPKPRFMLMAQIHAREIATGDMAYRWLDYLIDGYGKDKTVTDLMNSTEMWVIPIVNPDGVDIVQSGGDSPYLQRKNADATNGSNCSNPPTSDNQIGVDLNRNADYQWGGASTTDEPCGEVYKGPSADSEPELTSLQKLFTELYPAVRTGQGETDPSPTTAKGVFITLHSNSSQVLFPWGYTTNHSGNDAALRAMGQHMAQLTGYQTGQPGEILYAASGITDDWTYGKLGLASFTIEVGDPGNSGCGSFTPAYTCMAQDYWPKLQPTFVYAAQQAAAPFANGGAPHARH